MRLRRAFFRILAVLFVLLILAAAIGAAILYPRYREWQKIADSFDLAEINAIPAISEVFDCDGQRYSRLEGEVRYVVPYDKISPNFIHALLAREDSRFYDHHGVDYSGIARAAVRNLHAGRVTEGASTLTQQLARNTFAIDPDRWRRKCIEALLAQRIERHFTKEQILEAYANRIYYGGGLYGVETASRACFGKSAVDLTLSEAAILAGLIRNPNRLSPLEDTRKALIQRDQVLARMAELKMISADEAEAARKEPMPLSKRLPPVMQKNYAMDAVMRDLAIILPREDIARGGLKIYTTIDRRLQLIAEDLVDGKLTALESQPGWSHPTRTASLSSPANGDKPTESPYVQGALVALDNDTGGIRAIVGGRNFDESPYNRAWLAQRQIGSTIKPFIYACAFSVGLLPGTLIDDGPLQPGDVAGLNSPWSPENSDGQNNGLQPAAIGLIRSRNTMTVRAGEFATLPVIHQMLLRCGFSHAPLLPSLYLGAFETTLKDLVGSYTLFPNDGLRRQPYVIERIEDRRGQTIYRAARAELQCVSPGVDYVVNELLRDVMRKGTAASAASLGLTIPAAGKTGTTDDFKDAWFVGYTTRLTCGVWVGFDRPQRIADHGYGAALALPIWVDFMQQAAQFKYEPADFTIKVPLQEVTLCRTSGRLATPECQSAGLAYTAQLPAQMVPAETCPQHGLPLVNSAPSASGPWNSGSATSVPPGFAPAPPQPSVPGPSGFKVQRYNDIP